MILCAAGDLVLQTRLPQNHKGIDALHSYISAADASFINLEVPIVERLCFCSTFSGCPPLKTQRYAVDVMRKYGFQACGCANNHTFDYGMDGMLQTMDILDQEQFPRAGVGRSLDEASTPAIVPTVEGNVAFFDLYCSYWELDSMRAGYSHDGIPARPGVNALRRTDESLVTSEEMKYMKDLAQRTLINAENDLENAFGYGSKDEKVFKFGTVVFREAEKTGKFSRPNEEDVKRIERSIRDAKRCNKYVIVSAHSHQFRGRLEHETDYFLEQFVHRCIDAGADAFVGTGTHMVKAIEIYKGKPIFYCVGNFVFQGNYVPVLPADFLQMQGYSLDMTGVEAYAKLHDAASHSMDDIEIYWQGIIPRWEVQDGILKKIELLPIDMGRLEPMGLQGFPAPMAPEKIIDHLNMVCEPYGTKLQIKGDIIEVAVE